MLSDLDDIKVVGIIDRKSPFERWGFSCLYYKQKDPYVGWGDS